ncbi:hypothetical protein KMW28_21845 [Flammeovirga yaeyamensis]|uniref:Glycoside hydrolase family 42 N-terminal domain-containing protein n=1 Tax=Flammeovirga yaeyamensis TaxID=367791 RepID=A0AAX1NBW5_9BACT|nr:hypothetical protein [Flammeovirga yaeyamensis]MBB3697001.1 hypothetical protein [Flammeovirga yaeyamensis]NMF33664.1 hypothetical protein [Flammeovirga yaeyamensis]QWG05070.1 hypothetical protein KMW28_21845 [Flammeovirga yaeyamensis]
MKKILIYTALLIVPLSLISARYFDELSFPYWPSYKYLEIDELSSISPQKWITEDHVLEGWDWSLPPNTKPAPSSLVGLQRNIGLHKDFKDLNLQFESNSVGILWVKWRDIEKEPGVYDFSKVIKRIKQAKKVDTDILLRILCHARSRGSDDKALQRGDAPLWLDNYHIDLLPQKTPKHNINYNPASPVFHYQYLKLIDALGKTEIPKLVKAAYVGYASPSFGDEGIGPYGEKNSAANDTVPHVRERLDAWQNAFKGMESKIFMGGPCDYGFQKGFGVRRGYVEMYYYNIPNHDLGQYLDENGYLMVDENSPILKNKTFNGEVNEEYEEDWATSNRGFRFGKDTSGFPYRYFMSNLRALQMRCTYIHTTGHLIPEMLPFISLELGRTVEDTPDVWSFLTTSYIGSKYYQNHDYRNRQITDQEKSYGIELKNFERWLYQRDAEGYETTPAVKINHPIKMWMMEKGKYYDYIARSGQKIGFDIDDRWNEGKKLAIKVSYFDQNKGGLVLKYNAGEMQKAISTEGDGKLKTATFVLPKIQKNSMDHAFDFTLESNLADENIVVSMVRVINY